MLKEWFYYFFQCTECRRCSVFCPYGIDTAEITMMARELMMLVGLNINWVMEPVANCHRTGNHLGIQPHTFKDNIEFLLDELEDVTGVQIEPPINRKGAEILFVMPSADYFADPGTYTFMGYLMLFQHIGLDYTLSAYASEGGNFGLFTSHDTIKRLNYKIYHEAKRLGVKWILGGECGHMWRVLHQYMDTMNGPADFLEVPQSPITGTVFDNAASTKMVHICEFTADLIRNNKLKLDTSRNDNLPGDLPRLLQPGAGDGLLRGAALRPQERLQQLLRDAREHHPRADLLLCGRRRPRQRREHGDAAARRPAARQRGAPRARQARRQPADLHLRHRPGHPAAALRVLGARASRSAGVHELVGNALIMEGENERTTNLRGEPLDPSAETEESTDA